MRLLTAGLVLLGLAFAPTAHAGALPPAGLTAGGGGLGNEDLDGRTLTLRVGADGRALRLAGSFAAKCGPRAILVRTFRGATRIEDDGSFRVRLKTRTPGGFYFRGKAGIIAKGTFDGTTASGTLAFTSGAYAKGSRRRACPTTAGAFEVRDPGQLSGRSRKLTRGQRLYGLTDDRFAGLPMAAVVQVSSSRRRLNTVLTGINLRCEGEPDHYFNYALRGKVRKGGAFRGPQRFSVRYTNAVSRYSGVVSGRLADGGIVGRIALAIRIRFNKGDAAGRIARCRNAASTSFSVVP